ncbi:hypothetical protein Cgig2_024037 [Carnegiea gigantea]|uniref:Uncharacterized protein n=1 Tax=Carnegiea gigantea TaxID=171969 RepID=A0A9Q1KJF9_9CARY|nr:hypothetical protein Cgig2_024037 [Carnegiea gigantea]
MEMESPCDALVKSKDLKEEGEFLKTKDYRLALYLYEKSMQFLCVCVCVCVCVPRSENDAVLIEDLAITINLNTATCCLKLNEFELAKRQCDLVMKLDQRAQAFLHVGLKEEARQDISDAIRFDPCNGELNRELWRIENLCNQSREKEPSEGR